MTSDLTWVTSDRTYWVRSSGSGSPWIAWSACEVLRPPDAEAFLLCFCCVTAWGEDGAAAA